MNPKTLYKKAKKGAGEAALVGLVALAGAGCGETGGIIINDVSVNDYQVTIVGFNSGVRHITISPPTLKATDWNGDSRFDDIDLLLVPKGHPLEAYANPDSLEAMWDRALQGAEQ